MVKGKNLADEALDFLTLDGEVVPPGESQAQAQTQAEPAPQSPEGAQQEGGEQVQGQAQVPAAAPAAPASQPGYVPLSAVLDEREKRQALERQLQELQSKQQPPKTPDASSDPTGWAKAQEERLASFELATKMRMSGAFAAQHYGPEAVEAAKAWGAEQNTADPYFGAKFTAQDHPWQWLVEQHRQAQMLERLGGKSLEDWALEHAAAQGYAKAGDTTQQAAAAQAPAQSRPPQQAAPPRSIANAPPAGGTAAPVTLREDELLGDIFR